MNRRSRSAKWKLYLEGLIETGGIYAIVGIISAAIAMFFIPVIGVVTIYCGYKLHVSAGKSIAAVILILVGLLPLVHWIVNLAGL